MANNFDLFFARVLEDEGTRYECVAGDNGGPTCCGLTIFDIAKWNNAPAPKPGTAAWDALTQKVREVTPTSARDIYKRFYWDDVRADDLPNGLDYAVVDYAVNSGQGRAIPTLGTLVGCPDRTVTDTMIEAIGSYGSVSDLIQRYQDSRRAFLDKISRIPHNAKFRTGWMDRVERVRKLAIDLAAHAEPQAIVSVYPKAIDTSADQLGSTNAVAIAAKSPTVWSLLTAAWASLYGGFEKAMDAASGLLGSAGDIKADADATAEPLLGLVSILKLHAPEIGTAIAVACVVVAIVRHVDLHRTVGTPS